MSLRWNSKRLRAIDAAERHRIDQILAANRAFRSGEISYRAWEARCDAADKEVREVWNR